MRGNKSGKLTLGGGGSNDHTNVLKKNYIHPACTFGTRWVYVTFEKNKVVMFYLFVSAI